MIRLFRGTLAGILLFFPILASARAESLPEFRPALLGRSPRSLINLINGESLMKRGQRDAVVLFSVGVTPLGNGYGMQVYRGSPNSELLQKELLDLGRRAEFEPAVYTRVKRAAYIDGTVSFSIVGGKPRVRLYLHQEEDEFKAGHDFIAPQLTFLPGNTRYRDIYYPPSAPGAPGVAAVRLNVDATGKVKAAKVTYEFPAHQGFGAAVAGPIPDAVFIPGFRNGKAVDCQFTFSVVFPGPGQRMRTG